MTDIKGVILKQIHDENVRHESVMRELKNKLELIETQKRLQRSSNYDKRKKNLDESAKWVAENIKVGDIIKVTGSRAGPYRKVIAVDKYYVIGMVVRQKYKSKANEFTDGYATTEQGFNKVTHILKDDQFVSVFDLMKETI